MKKTLKDFLMSPFLPNSYAPTPTPSPLLSYSSLPSEELNAYLATVTAGMSLAFLRVGLAGAALGEGNRWEVLMKGTGSDIYKSSRISSSLIWMGLTLWPYSSIWVFFRPCFSTDPPTFFSSPDLNEQSS